MIADFLTQLARIEWRNPQRKGFGDTTPAPAVVTGWEAVPCLVRPLRAESRAMQGRDGTLSWHRIYFDQPMDLTKQHRIVVDGKIYAVSGSVDINSLGELTQVDCTRVDA